MPEGRYGNIGGGEHLVGNNETSPTIDRKTHRDSWEGNNEKHVPQLIEKQSYESCPAPQADYQIVPSSDTMKNMSRDGKKIVTDLPIIYVKLLIKNYNQAFFSLQFFY